jgi:hypothetical protein
MSANDFVISHQVYALINFILSFHSCNVIYQLQTVSSRQEKS